MAGGEMFRDRHAGGHGRDEQERFGA